MKNNNYLIPVIILVISVLSSCNKDKIFVETDDIIGIWRVSEGEIVCTQYNYDNDYTLEINYSMTADSCICTLLAVDTFQEAFIYINEIDFQKNNTLKITSNSNLFLKSRVYEGAWEIMEREKESNSDSIGITIYSFYNDADEMDISEYDLFDYSIKLIEKNGYPRKVGRFVS